MLTVVEGHRQALAAHTGLPEQAAAAESLPLEDSICERAVASGRPLIVGDARRDPLLQDIPPVADLGMVAYAGIPLITTERQAVGSLCAADVVPRDWLDDQLAQLALLADIAADEVELQRHRRAAALRREWAGVPELNWNSARW